MQISLVAALSQNHVIGKQGQMPWHLPNDLRHFKQVTLGKPIIMGRKTFTSIGRALPGRRNIVVSRQPRLVLQDVEVYSSLESVWQALAAEPEIMVIGGGDLYQQLLPQADRMYLTLIDCQVSDGDTFFPRWDKDVWQVVNRESYAADARHDYAYTFLLLERINDRG